MLIEVNGELLDGFHIEQLPQFNTDNQFDTNALSGLAGMRAVWLLYWLGRWEHLEDLGVDRATVEPVLKKFSYGKRLTVRQVQQLQKKVPALVEASKELRLAYALKQLDKPSIRSRSAEGKRKQKMEDMYIYHAELPTVLEAEDAKARHEPEVTAARGTIEVGRGVGQSGAILMVKLPASLQVNASDVLRASGLKFSQVRAAVIMVPQNQGADPRPSKENE